MTPATAPLLAWGAAGRPLEGVSGDHHVVVPYAGGVLVAVIDGLGHGVEAAVAAQRAGDVLQAHAGQPVTILVERCHEALAGTRGAVMSLAAIDAAAGSLTWVGVGNVEAALLRGGAAGRAVLTACGGVVGYRLPPLRPQSLPVTAGDTLVLATDGVRPEVAAGPLPAGPPQQVAEDLLARYGRTNDDALVVVATYQGGAAP